MSVDAPPAPSGSFGAPACPSSWVLPKLPDEDVSAVRQVADGYRQLAGELRGAAQAAQLAMSPLPGAWQGQGAAAARHPTAVLLADTDVVCRGLLAAADALTACAAQLQRAHDEHGWSLSKVLKVGAVVAVSAAAVTVTAGTAAPEVAAADAAVISGEVAAAEGAVASAVAARTGVSIALSSSARMMAATRGLATFLRPQLPWAFGLTGLDATHQVERTGSLNPRELAISFGMSVALPPVLGRTRRAVRELPVLAQRPAARSVADHLTTGGVIGSFDAVRQELLTGRVDRTHAITSGVTGAGLSVVGGVSKRILPPNWRPGVRSDIAGDAASGQRQSLAAALKNGVNLDAHEGSELGHTLQRHVGKPFAYLQHRLDTETGAEKSSFTNRGTAETAITATLRHHRRAVLALEAGTSPRLPPLRLTFATPLGKLLRRDGSAHLGRTCVIIVRRNAAGTFLLTAWLER